MTRMLRAAVVLACLGALLQSQAFSQGKKKNKKDEDFTQTLAVAPDPPSAVAADTAKLSFLIAPLSAKGLLSQQTRDALKWLMQNSKGSQFVRIRAYVAGTGDLRRIPSLVSEMFTEKKIALPVVTVVQVGGLPLEAAQLQLVATVQDRKTVNPGGVLFLAAQQPSLQQSMEQLRSRAGNSEVQMLACAAPTLEEVTAARTAATTLFPRAQLVFYQAQRSVSQPVAACEGVARLAQPPDGGARFQEGAVAVSSPRLIFSGAQLAFRYQEADARLAFQRLEKTLQSLGGSLKRTVSLNAYPLSPQLADLVARVRLEFLDRDHLPSGTSLPYEGLPSMDASFGLEAITLGSPTP
ncbi:RidA family protein [Paludibaculum fermentans]|uniref:RidA family protein n=1 Tax=Paludibaculum fermentans TaxID=1473598 RepID=A0A7S7NU19_PALFE|nr:RidA family protein [Paludibaculum fermentans]QOY89249.1 RidA family protein [Paludibaculum fermentans]